MSEKEAGPVYGLIICIAPDTVTFASLLQEMASSLVHCGLAG